MDRSDRSLPAISVLNPDLCYIDQHDAAARESYTGRVEGELRKLEAEEMVFLRGLPEQLSCRMRPTGAPPEEAVVDAALAGSATPTIMSKRSNLSAAGRSSVRRS